MKTILFHGGTHIIESPEIRIPTRTLDFGKGFYLTSSQNQAERWVASHLRNSSDIGFVNSYEFDLSDVPDSFSIKIFETANDEWVDFVQSNRIQAGFTHDYDIVIGPVADDKVYTQFSLFEGGIISKETLIAELKTYRLVDQYLFHTERSLNLLKFLGYYSIKP